MFGLSLTKILFTLLVVGLVWYAFRRLNRPLMPGANRRWFRRRADEPAREARIEDMVQCRLCGDYLATGAGACGREGCPRAG